MRVVSSRHQNQLRLECNDRRNEQLVEHRQVVVIPCPALMGTLIVYPSPAPRPRSPVSPVPDRTETGESNRTAPGGCRKTHPAFRCRDARPSRRSRRAADRARAPVPPNGHVVQQAEAHPSLRSGVMARRTHERERMMGTPVEARTASTPKPAPAERSATSQESCPTYVSASSQAPPPVASRSSRSAYHALWIASTELKRASTTAMSGLPDSDSALPDTVR